MPFERGQNQMTNNLYEKLKARLERNFIKCEEIARILALAISSGKNVILWGPGGHGKSEMVSAALEEVASEEDIFVQSFGEGMDEATLWGGLDFKALDTEKVLRYFPESSFLAKPFVVFEEIFDAPASVLLALKDTLTARKLRKGGQQFPMATKVVIALTNKAPSEISDLGPAAAALIERFPLQLEVKWPSYSSADYSALLTKVAPRLESHGAELNGHTPVLAELLSKATENGVFISPRSAVHAAGVAQAAAAMRGSHKVERQDLLDLVYVLPGLQGIADSIRAELVAAEERAAVEKQVANAEAKLAQLLRDLDSATGSPIKLLQSAKYLGNFADEVASLKVTDAFTSRRKGLRETAQERSTKAQQAALEATRV
jgi:MoxR-like ATPase